MIKNYDAYLIISIIITAFLYLLGFVLDNSFLKFVQGFSTAIVVEFIFLKVRNKRHFKAN